MRWTEYTIAMLLFSVVSMLLTYLIERVQQWLPWNPQHLPNVPAVLAMNTAASFTTNTNWQAYVPEATMSYLTQMAGLAYHNFASAAVGIALAIALIRGISRREQDTLGNFWVDITRSMLWVLVPISIVLGLVLVSQGVVQNFRPYDTAHLVEPQKVVTQDSSGKSVTQTITTQTIAQGPVASQEAIKMLGTNGGGFFNANSAHPFENPTPFSNLLEMLAIFAISAGLTVTLGRMTHSPLHGWAVFAAMADFVFRRCHHGLLGGGSRQSPDAWGGAAGIRNAGWRQHGRQRGALRNCQLRTVCDGDYGCELRCGERNA